MPCRASASLTCSKLRRARREIKELDYSERDANHNYDIISIDQRSSKTWVCESRSGIYWETHTLPTTDERSRWHKTYTDMSEHSAPICSSLRQRRGDACWPAWSLNEGAVSWAESDQNYRSDHSLTVIHESNTSYLTYQTSLRWAAFMST